LPVLHWEDGIGDQLARIHESRIGGSMEYS